ncbi:MAG: MogA/MoaB family molybdenum cofactor biosynthesis protein [Methanomicrobiales archaeon]|jgi:molybdenum cofactor biosynthesis protein B|nr:MogA/MoaB family molybdenum cofactor biosynthesis protein [Methanomicrobiales archaeon]
MGKIEHTEKIMVRAAVITVSSTRTLATDKSGQCLQDLLSTAGIGMTHYSIVPDDILAIRREVLEALKTSSCIIVHGGTGLTHDDCTIEAVGPLLEKQMDGFGELFRMLSFQDIGSSAILSRAIAGTIRGNAVFCIPGSQGAVELAFTRLILPEIHHILSHAGR